MAAHREQPEIQTPKILFYSDSDGDRLKSAQMDPKNLHSEKLLVINLAMCCALLHIVERHFT